VFVKLLLQTINLSLSLFNCFVMAGIWTLAGRNCRSPFIHALRQTCLCREQFCTKHCAINNSFTGWIRKTSWNIESIPVQIHVLRVEADGVNLQESPQRLGVHAIPVIVQAEFGEVFAAGEEEAVPQQG
jgi:hypothetical protein